MYNRDRLIIILTSIFLFRIPVSRIIGDNGCGYLSGAMETFWCVALLFGAGLTITLRGMMHDRVRRGQYYNASLVFSFAKRYTFIAAIALMLISLAGYELISTRVFSDIGGRLAFIFTGPAIALLMLINLNIGYLNGTDNMHAALIGEIVFAVASGAAMIGGGLIGTRMGSEIAALLHNEEVTAMYGAAGTMAGLCVGEFISLAVLMTMTIVYQRSFRHMMRTESGRRTEYVSDISGRFLLGVLADGGQELILHLPMVIAIILFRRIGASDVDASAVGAAVGAFYSKYIVITGVFAALATIPVQGSLKGVAAAVNDNDTQLASERITRMFGKVTYFAIPAVIFITMLVPVLVPTLYTGRLTTVISLLNMGTSTVFVYAVTYCFVSVLIKLGYNREMLVVSAAALVAGTVLSAVLMKKYGNGFTGAILGMMASYALCLAVCFIILLRNFRLRLRLLYTLLIPLVIAVLIGLGMKLLGGALYEPVGGILTLVICIIPAWFLYNIGCMITRVVSASAMSKKFLGPLLVRIGQNLGIY